MNNKNYNNAIIDNCNNAIANGSMFERGNANNCAGGNAFEIACKQVMNGNKFKGVSKANGTDAKSKGYKYEIKTNCGGLNNIEKNDFVIYAIIEKGDEITTEFASNQSFVIPANEFMEGLNELGLIRTKDGNRTTIQSFKNSKKKYEALFDWLYNYPNLAEHLEGLQ